MQVKKIKAREIPFSQTILTTNFKTVYGTRVPKILGDLIELGNNNSRRILKIDAPSANNLAIEVDGTSIYNGTVKKLGTVDPKSTFGFTFLQNIKNMLTPVHALSS